MYRFEMGTSGSLKEKFVQEGLFLLGYNVNMPTTTVDKPTLKTADIKLNRKHRVSTNSSQVNQIAPDLIDTIQVIDCIKGMKTLPDNSIDVAVADPPYNASKGNMWQWDNSVQLPGFGGNWSKVSAGWDDMPLKDYFTFTVAWVSELKRVVRPSGSIWIHGTYHNIGIINFVLQLLEVEIINEIVWYKRNSFPNLSCRRLTASHETVLWAHTGGKKRQYFFNYEAAKEMPYPEDGLKTAGKQMRTVWDIPNNKDYEEISQGKHPTQKPLRLLKRMLMVSTRPGNILLSPFAGVGSECVAARNAGLHYLGFETSTEYARIANKRLKQSPIILSGQCAEPPKPLWGIEVQNKSRSRGVIPSLIKWTGSKRSQAYSIVERMPHRKRYFEPFLGGGAVLFLAAESGAVAGDVYKPLIELWKTVQRKPQLLIENYREQWQALQDDFPGYFYTVRERFNQNPNALDLNFVMRTCVNGIVRFNGDGRFNNSFHLSRKGMAPKRFERIVNEWHKVIQGVRFVCRDYAETVAEAEKGDFVYFDPPYAGNKQRYTENLDLKRFYKVLEDLNHRDVKWALSFDGRRGNKNLTQAVPRDLYKSKFSLLSGNSPVGKVLNGPIENVKESLYLNY